MRERGEEEGEHILGFAKTHLGFFVINLAFGN